MLRSIRAMAFAIPLLTPLAAQAGSLVTAEQAIELALATDPGIKAAEAGTFATQAGLRQADRLPNPVLGITVENFGGTDSFAGRRSAEYTLSYGQTIELGGDRSARKAVAGADIKLANARLAIQRLDIAETVRSGYIQALASEEKLKLARERVAFQAELAKAVRQRMQNGRDSSMVDRQAQASLHEAEVDLMRAERSLRQSRARLAALWNGVDDGFALERGVFDVISSDSHTDASLPGFLYPDVAQYEAAKLRADADIDLEKARAVSDVEISGGIRRFESGRETAFVVGLSIPFPVFDSNRNNIERARSERLRADFEGAAARRAIELKLSAAISDHDSARAEIETIRKDVMPQAARALTLARSGYAQGAFSYLQIVDAARSLNALQERLVAALQTFHESQIAIDRLTGRFSETGKNEGYRP